MKRNYWLFFIELTVFFTVSLNFLITGLFASNGLLANMDLARRIKSTQKTVDILTAQIESLNLQGQLLSSDSGWRETAQRLGYTVSGETVYEFDTREVQETPDIGVYDDKDFNTSSYNPLSRIGCFLVATIAAMVLSGFISFISYMREKSDGSEEDGPQYDSDDYIIS